MLRAAEDGVSSSAGGGSKHDPWINVQTSERFSTSRVPADSSRYPATILVTLDPATILARLGCWRQRHPDPFVDPPQKRKMKVLRSMWHMSLRGG
ncbi:hypothetical protein D4764_13G0008260 [Takifugu flavidus]|uniref:Uncharacterized protein n=1 Tax=Takifugu flavidus TaxID=433684 RepID=A0A5C6P8M2_9TELE|nr:hypothetical protein D4764_13G0008260 [Takifugu flavidus]